MWIEYSVSMNTAPLPDGPVRCIFDLVFRNGNFQLLRPPEDGIPNYVVGLDTIRAQPGFGIDGVLELVVGEVRWDDFRADVEPEPPRSRKSEST